MPAPSSDTYRVRVQETNAALPGVQVKVTVAYPVYQPNAFGGGETCATMVGPSATIVRARPGEIVCPPVSS